MKSAVETLTPTRVRLTVEVPFEELQPSVDAAYRKIAQQVRVQGFRPGKVPPRIIDQRFGRGPVIEEAVQEAIPRFYGDAVRDAEVTPLGHPDVDVTTFDDGVQLVFTAEVDVRPNVELPAYDALQVTVDDAEVDDAVVEEQVASLRDRFATLTAVERPVESGDFVSIDLTATVDGEAVPGGEATGLSYEVGSETMLPGLDEALLGMTEEESRSFDSELVAGDYAGRIAAVTVTVRSVKVKQLPELDDEFAPTASEFDTMDELRTDIRIRLERVRRLEQGVQARDRVLEALLAATDVPLPESIVSTELEWRRSTFEQQLEQMGISRDDYLTTEARTSADLDAEIEQSAHAAVKAQLVLDAIADREQVGIDDAELTDQVVRRAQRAGVPVDDYAQTLVRTGQLGALVADVRRGKALTQVLESATIVDGSGRSVDLAALSESTLGPVEAIGAEQGDDELLDESPDGGEDAVVEAVVPGTAEDPDAGEVAPSVTAPEAAGDVSGEAAAVLEAELPGTGPAPS